LEKVKEDKVTGSESSFYVKVRKVLPAWDDKYCFGDVPSGVTG
jgi:hypothetical protein